MATNEDFIEYVCDQIADAGRIRYKKMFGEYMAYCNDKPVLLVCDNMVFAKKLPEIEALYAHFSHTPEEGLPYPAAKPHYIVDIDDHEFVVALVRLLTAILPVPKPKK